MGHADHVQHSGVLCAAGVFEQVDQHNGAILGALGSSDTARELAIVVMLCEQLAEGFVNGAASRAICGIASAPDGL
jgi:hypothetical protein